MDAKWLEHEVYYFNNPFIRSLALALVLVALLMPLRKAKVLQMKATEMLLLGLIAWAGTEAIIREQNVISHFLLLLAACGAYRGLMAFRRWRASSSDPENPVGRP